MVNNLNSHRAIYSVIIKNLDIYKGLFFNHFLIFAKLIYFKYFIFVYITFSQFNIKISRMIQYFTKIPTEIIPFN